MGHGVSKGRRKMSTPVFCPPVSHPFLSPSTAMLEPTMETPPQIQVPEVIRVMLQVLSIWPPYRRSISVPAGSSLEDVLKKAQKLGGFM